MNKYQEALNGVATCARCIDCECDDLMLLRKLVNKETPQKIVKLPKKQPDYAYLCPSCGKVLGKVVTGIKIPYFEEDKYCCNCGQAIDWSGEDA